MEIVFRYGILCDSLEKQANEQGFTLGDKSEKFEKIRNAISMCKFHVATESQTESMFKKLQKEVVKALKPLKEVNK